MEVMWCRTMPSEVKWLKHYSSEQSILVVGDRDFSFSLALVTAFGNGENIVATSLDSYVAWTEALIGKYTEAEQNVMDLRRMRVTVLHGVDATTMKTHIHLKMTKFDRIVFNFPHAGFKAKDYKENMVNLNKDLVKGFLRNARDLVQRIGEVHINHKIGYPYDAWDLEQLALESSLYMITKAKFKKEDYPGYNQKRGDGAKCNRSFPLGDCCTYRFWQLNEGELQNEIEIATYLAKIVRILVPPEEWSAFARPVRQSQTSYVGIKKGPRPVRQSQ